MRRFCITLVIVPSLLVASAPAHAKTTATDRHQARTAVAHQDASTKRLAPTRTARLKHKYTYGRT